MLGAVAICGAMALAACGGGGGGGDGGTLGTTPQTATGVFKDSNVVGISYTSGGQSGVTGTDGRFTYEVGKSVTFKVGSVTLGSATGKSLITPVDLVSSGTSSTMAVQNIARFLMMLDADGDASNGVTISDNVRARAGSWNQVDFATSDLTTALANVIADARSADAGTHSLPDAATARSHLESTFRCAYSGGFRGAYTGGDKGRFGLMITKDGAAIGVGSSSSNPGFGFIAQAGAPIVPAQNVTFVAGVTSSGASFSGSLSSPDALSGNWNDVDHAISGTFSGTRVGGAVNAEYRFTGIFGSNQNSTADVGLFTFDIDPNNAVTGYAYSLISDQLVTLTGNLVGTTLSGSASSGATVSGTLDKVTGALTGTWNNASAAGAGTFAGTGCRLN